jgi:WD40 repeat protein/serine/threonine protein kinase
VTVPHDKSRRVAAWIEAARGGSAEALGYLLELFRPYLLRLARLYLERDLNATVDASDLVQETIVDAKRQFTDFHGTADGELRAWLRPILDKKLLGLGQNRLRPDLMAGQHDASGGALPDRSSQRGSEKTKVLPEPATQGAIGENVFGNWTVVEGQEDTETKLGPMPFELGPFHVRRVLGIGAFGVVYLAKDSRLGRLVAVKVPQRESLINPLLRQRFLREARAAAQLHHANIVPIFDVGEANGACYIVSAYCRGGSLAGWLNSRSAPVPFRLAAHLTAYLADGVQHAHDCGILHRDLKPGNVLIQPDGPPGDPEGIGLTPMISDFGLAKFLEAAAETSPAPIDVIGAPGDAAEDLSNETRGIAGTPAYMAPEQAGLWSQAIGRATDVYGLGCILYQLLTGRPPFTGSTRDILRQVREDEPSAPSRLRPGLPRDLEMICLKCLSKAPGERYPTARDLGDDLRRWLGGESVRARPVGPLRRMAKWVRRRPTAAGLVALSLLTGFALLASTLWYASVRTREELQQRRLTYATNIAQAQRSLDGGDFHGLTELLNGLRPPLAGPDLRGFEWYYLWRRYLESGMWLSGHENAVSGIAFSPDGRTLASVGHDGTLRLWDTEKAEPRATIRGHTGSILALAFSPDGNTLATMNDDRIISIWEMPGPRLKTTINGTEANSNALTFSPAGDTLATSGGGAAVLLWDLATAHVRARLGQTHNVNGIAFTLDGKSLISAEVSGVLRIWDAKTGGEKAKASVPGHRNCWAVAISPDGRLLASGGDDNDISLWDVRSLALRATLTGPGGPVKYLAFSRGGRELVAGSVRPNAKAKTGVQLWNVNETLGRAKTERRPEATFDLSNTDFTAVQLSRDGRTLALASNDALIRLWRPIRQSERLAPMSHTPDEAWAVAFSPDGTLLATAGDNERRSKCLKVWDPATGKLRWEAVAHTALATSIAFSTDGRLLASAGYDGKVKLWDPFSGREQASINAETDLLRCLALSPNGRIVAAGGRHEPPTTSSDHVAHLWDTATGQVLYILRGHGRQIRSIVFSPDGRRVVTASDDQIVRIWDVESGLELRSFREVCPVQCVAYTPDGKALVWGTQSGQLARLHLATGQLERFAGRHAGEIRALSFTPDGSRLATGGSDGIVRLWDTTTGAELLTLLAGSLPINSVAFSPTGDRLASAGHDGAVKIWYSPRGR